jgi:hypothetical protein
MDLNALLEATRDSILAITEPRFYQTERGFQGQLLVELSRRRPDYILANHAILEQEHQKTLDRQGLDIRPDIIIHTPFDPAVHASRQDGNFAVIELKLRAGPKRASEDFASLISMLDRLHYPIGIFINVGHSKTQAVHIPAESRGRIVAFSVQLTTTGVRFVEECA